MSFKTSAPDPTFRVISVTTQKALNNPAGTFSITLAGDEWAKDKPSGGIPSKKLRPNDLVIITMGYKGKTADTVMVGLIDSVELDRSVDAQGKPTVVTTVTGRDFGKVLLKATLKFYPTINGAKPDASGETYFLTKDPWTTFWTTYLPPEEKLMSTPALLADRTIRFVLQKLYNVKWNVYDTRTNTKKTPDLAQIFRYMCSKTQFTMPFNLTLDGFDGSVWNLLERATIKPVMEIFVDTRTEKETDGEDGWLVKDFEEASIEAKSQLKTAPYASPAITFGSDMSKVVLTMRNTPFTKELWDSKKRHTLTDVDVINEKLRVSDNEHFNVFFAGSSLAPMGISLEDQKKLFVPLMNEADAKRYGLSPLEIDVRGMEVSRVKLADPNEKPKVVEQMKGFADGTTKLLKSWYEKNHEYKAGTLEVRGNGSYKIGQVLDYEELDYYIEGVTQSFHQFMSWQTTLSVTRGYNKEDRFKG